MISAVIVCLNEAEKLERCLKSLIGFADEIVILDLGSSDESKNICKKYQTKIFQHSPVPVVEEIRNYAISKANGDWILVLDPDEILTDKLKEILKQISSSKEFEVVNIPRKNIFFGHWIAHTNWWPDRHIRFFKKGKVSWKETIHSYPEVQGDILSLEAKEDFSIMHFGYQSVSEFLERQDRYSTIEAENLFLNKIKFSWIRLFWRPAREVLVRYFRHAGFLDGFYGFALTILMVIYQFEVAIKLWEKGQRR